MMTPETLLNGRVDLWCGDNREALKRMPDNSVDSIVTDPPYALVSITKRFGKAGAAPAKGNEAYARASAGFMGKQWDTGETAFAEEFWSECLRVLKPGGHVVAFSGTRSYHRLVCAIEDAGFEIRDQLAWVYGSGFPKSHNMSGDWQGWGTALKPAWEPICLARKPLVGTVAANVLAHGTGALNIDGCRVATAEALVRPEVKRINNNVLGGGLGAGVQQEPEGRWPANIVHDGSDEVLAGFPETGAAKASDRGLQQSGRHGGVADLGVNIKDGTNGLRGHDDQGGSAARFFYSAKADSHDRIGSKHPTVKPVDLMQWLCRLITPPGGVVLDPFAGSGSTGEAAFREGFRAILCEREEEYQADIRRRMALCLAGPDERKRESIKARGRASADAGPLFGGG